MKTIYRVEIRACKDYCSEFWTSCPLSPFYESENDAKEKLAELSGYDEDGILSIINAVSIGKCKPRIVTYDLISGC